jgi:hypothetical protein
MPEALRPMRHLRGFVQSIAQFGAGISAFDPVKSFSVGDDAQR